MCFFTFIISLFNSSRLNLFLFKAFIIYCLTSSLLFILLLLNLFWNESNSLSMGGKSLLSIFFSSFFISSDSFSPLVISYWSSHFFISSIYDFKLLCLSRCLPSSSCSLFSSSVKELSWISFVFLSSIPIRLILSCSPSIFSSTF